MHHAHRHACLPGTDCNCGDVLSIWDRLFGTQVLLPRDKIQFGVDSHIDQDTDPLDLLGVKSVGRFSPARIAERFTRP
jgi:sterol desaturase/sphingolipid hydroxylase (fatty acid hydroxylase superfamily)